MTSEESALSAGSGESPLSLDPDTFISLAHGVAQWAAHYQRTVRERPAFHPMTESDHRAILELPLQDNGASFEEFFTWLKESVFPFPSPQNHPGSVAWITSPAAPVSMLASWIAAVLNPHCGVGDHAAMDVERRAISMLIELVGFPSEGSQGILTSGGSMANLVCLAAARYWFATKHGWNVRDDGMQGSHHPPLVLYVSEEAHSSLFLAAELLGVGRRYMRRIPVSPDNRMSVDALCMQIEIDLAEGLLPWCVVANLGSTSTGAIDPLRALAGVCAARGLWFHGDGAYGGFGVVVPELAEMYDGFELLSSLSIDPHKMLCVSIGCGAALIQRGSLRETFSLKPSYLASDGEPLHELTFELTRRFRALPLFAVLQALGKDGVQLLVERYIQLARYLVGLVQAAPEELELLSAGPLSVVCFRYAPAALRNDHDGGALNVLNTALVKQLQASGTTFITGVELFQSRVFALRACVCNYLTEKRDLDTLVRETLTLGRGLVVHPATV